MAEANFLTGSRALIAIDKVGNQVMFLDPDSYETVLSWACRQTAGPSSWWTRSSRRSWWWTRQLMKWCPPP